MRAYILKDLLNLRGGQVKKTELLKMEACEGEKALKSSIRYLVDLGLAVETKDTVQAKTATGKLVPFKEVPRLKTVTPEVKKIPPARKAGAARAARMRSASEDAFPARLEAIRQGATFKQAFGSTGNHQYFVKTHPELADAIEAARKEGMAKLQKELIYGLKVKALAEITRAPAGTDKLMKLLKSQEPVKAALRELEQAGLIAREEITLKWRRK